MRIWLDKHAPESRQFHRVGTITALPVLGRLHHHSLRILVFGSYTTRLSALVEHEHQWAIDFWDPVANLVTSATQNSQDTYPIGVFGPRPDVALAHTQGTAFEDLRPTFCGSNDQSDPRQAEAGRMDTNGAVVLPEQASVWKMDSERVATFRLMSEQTGDCVSVFEESIPKGVETFLHLHHGSDETMCVLSGEFAFKIGDAIMRGGVGTWAFMPREVAHAWKNVTQGTARALFMFTPAGAGKVFEELRRRQVPFLSADPALLSQLFRQHGWEILGPAPVYEIPEK